MGSPVRLEAAIEESYRYEREIEALVESYRPLWAHLFQPGKVKIARASKFEDTHLATDYVCTVTDTSPLAVRLRSFDYLMLYGGEFVLRNSAPPGMPTEADKITTDPSSARLYFYAFENPLCDGVIQWVLVDCVKLRVVYAQSDGANRLAAHPVRFDAVSMGLALSIDALIHEGCVIAAHIARPAFTRQSKVRALLATRSEMDGIDPANYSRIELLLMHLMKETREYRAGDSW